MGYKIKKANEMLNEIAAAKAKFHLIEKHEITNVMHSERETYSFVNTSDVIGRDEDKKNMIKSLMHPTDGKHISVLPIVGIGGIGKTALAQLVFNDEKVETDFELRIWVCVTEDFDIRQLMIKIIKSATGQKCKDMNKKELQKFLQDCLRGKRFLLVLDDVWNEDKKKWIELKNLLAGGAEGSKIIVTTRSNKVATVTGTIPKYDLESLSDENSLSLFLKLAFKEGEERQHPNLVKIGEEIVKKCKGVALAVKTLGSLLCSTVEEHEWKVVRDSEIWRLEQKEDDILPALKLSYDHLPWHLKQCFAYCSVYPKDHEFMSFDLVSVWMAHGLLQSSNENEEPEDIGNRYIRELCSRSFFQQVEDNFVIFTFKMHDLVHDLALSVAQNEVNSSNQYSTGNVRHLRFGLSGQGTSMLPNNLGHLRTFKLSGEGQKGSSETLIATCISRSKHLRVFDFGDSSFSFEQFPNSIRYLKHLRYLFVARIKKLPNFICYLQSLQTLILAECQETEELLRDIRYLISLRTLLITTTQTSLQQNGIGCLSSLRWLGIFECENLKYLFEDMQSLTALRTLCIVDCKNLISLPQGLKYLTALETLAIVGCEKLDISMPMKLEFGGKEDGSLRNLMIGGLPKLESLPQWILIGSTRTLQQLWIRELENLSTMPSWFHHLISLQSLKIRDCSKQSSLPEGIQHLTVLKELEITGCPTLSKRCRQETGEEWHKISHVANLQMDDLETSTTDEE